MIALFAGENTVVCIVQTAARKRNDVIHCRIVNSQLLAAPTAVRIDRMESETFIPISTLPLALTLSYGHRRRLESHRHRSLRRDVLIAPRGSSNVSRPLARVWVVINQKLAAFDLEMSRAALHHLKAMLSSLDDGGSNSSGYGVDVQRSIPSD